MNSPNHVTDSNVVVDLSKFSAWEDAFAELKLLTLSRRSFWGETPLVLRFGEINLTEETIDSLKELINESNIVISEVQVKSEEGTKLLHEKGLSASSLSKVAPISSGIRLIKEAKPIAMQPSKTETVPFIPTSLPFDSYETNTAYLGFDGNIPLRAGNAVSYDGNVVILGDVNPGCQIKLTGSIIVYGKLCGSVHAGYGITDEEDVQRIFVKALRMSEPLQISIGEYSACSSNQNESNTKQKIYPETVRVIDGRIWRIRDFE
jgi:septum formation inhibitor MinC